MEPGVQYQLAADTDLYDSSECKGLATQAWKGRYFTIKGDAPIPSGAPAEVTLLEDGYECWLAPGDCASASAASTGFQKDLLSAEEIGRRTEAAVSFAEGAMKLPNKYFWGGTLGPSYDCSGLVQASFRAQGVWVPRDAYQQEAFARPVARGEISRGDLVFFGAEGGKIDHVGIVTRAEEGGGVGSGGEGGGAVEYVHSSGPSKGNDGMQVNLLDPSQGTVAAWYAGRFRGAGRVERCVEFAP